MAATFGNQQNNVIGMNQREKAIGFINIYVPRKDGTRKKLGAIPLRPSNKEDKQLSEWLEADAKNLPKLLKKIKLEFNAVSDNDSGLDLD